MILIENVHISGQISTTTLNTRLCCKTTQWLILGLNFLYTLCVEISTLDYLIFRRDFIANITLARAAVAGAP